jgi:hypothetical protein
MLVFPIQVGLANRVYGEVNEYDCSEFVTLVRELFEDVKTATSHRYGATDNQGYGLDALKIIENPEGGYLGVYHSLIGGTFQVRLATSIDLFSWTYIRTVELSASQPTIAQAPNDAYLVAFEKEEASSHLQFQYYSNLATLINGPPDATLDAQRTLSSLHEGTPNIYNITIEGSTLKALIGFHYDTGSVDNVAIGWLTIPVDNPQFMMWNDTAPLTRYNQDLKDNYQVRGNIGDRDYGQVFGRNFTLQEGCLIERNGHWAYWRIFLYDHLTNNFTLLNIKTHKGSTSFGNPTFTFLKSPNNKDCMVVTYFLFSEGAQEGEAGELIFYKEFNTTRLSIDFKGKSYFAEVTSNSTISNFYFNKTEKSLNFNVSGHEGSKGYCIAKLKNDITQDLWHGNYTVLLDNEPWQFENWTDTESTYIYLKYLHSQHKIKILPEFSNALLLMMLVGLATLLSYIPKVNGQECETLNNKMITTRAVPIKRTDSIIHRTGLKTTFSFPVKNRSKHISNFSINKATPTQNIKTINNRG